MTFKTGSEFATSVNSHATKGHLAILGAQCFCSMVVCIKPGKPARDPADDTLEAVFGKK
jgi:hypothetical protein